MSAADGMMIWTGDYLADTQHLSCTQHGAYLLILMALWRSGGTLPLDEVKLSRIARLPLNKWRTVSPAVMELMTIEGDCFTQKRLSSNLKTTLERIEKRRLSGRTGGAAKALNEKERKLATATNLLQQNPTDAPETKTWTGDLDKKERKENTSLRSVAHVSENVCHETISDWPKDYRERFWNLYPRKKAKKAAFAALDRIRKSGEVTFDRLTAGIAKIPIGEPVFIPHPATWLNQGRWDDEQLPGETNGHRGPRPLQDDRLSVSRAADKLIEQAERGEFQFGPRPRLLPESGETVVRLLPKG